MSHRADGLSLRQNVAGGDAAGDKAEGFLLDISDLTPMMTLDLVTGRNDAILGGCRSVPVQDIGVVLVGETVVGICNEYAGTQYRNCEARKNQSTHDDLPLDDPGLGREVLNRYIPYYYIYVNVILLCSKERPNISQELSSIIKEFQLRLTWVTIHNSHESIFP